MAKERFFSRIGILGMGRMAIGLAIDLALKGIRVDMIYLKPRAEEERTRYRKNLEEECRTVAKLFGRSMESFPLPSYLRAPAEVYDLVFEGLPEEIPVKASAFSGLNRAIGEKTLICSMTSTFTVEELAKKIPVPLNIVVSHFMNPPYLIPFLEVVPGPGTVSRIKLKATQAIGAEVILKGVVGDDAIAHAMEVAQRRNILFVHPHKTAPFLNGNGTIAQEILGELPSVEQIFIPVGGGGLASGVCQHIERNSLSVKAIGVEAEQAPAFHLSFKTGRPVRLEKMDTIADALTLMEPDPEVFSYLHKNLAEVVTVSEGEIVSAMKILLDEFRVIAEPGGAAPLAAMLKGDPNVPSAAIISGGNVSLEEFQNLLSRLES